MPVAHVPVPCLPPLVRPDVAARRGAPLAAVAGHLGDTVETVSRISVHWLRDDREVPASVLDRVLAPVSPTCHEGDKRTGGE